MRIGQATGLQIAFLLFAVLLLSVPISRGIMQLADTSPEWRPMIERGTQFVIGALLIVVIPGLRRAATLELSRPIPTTRRLEVVSVGIAKVSLAFASTAVLALWNWASEGAPGLERTVSDPNRGYANAFSTQGLVRYLLFATLIAPFVEELVCRGLLYRAFERQYGWFAAMLASSAIFGLLHPHFASAFASGIIFVCLLRRTGSLWAPIAVHAFYNFMLWWPMLGQHVFPTADAGNAETWTFHAICLVFVAIALPAYVWMSRDRHVVAPTQYLEPNGALQK